MNRVKIVIGEQGVERIKNAKILVLGAGGVGSHIAESLVRNGFKNLTIVDNDNLEYSNLNRHIYAFYKNIGTSKCEALKIFLENIYPDVNISTINCELSKHNVEHIVTNDFDFIADAIDKLITKTHILKICREKNIKIISSMGAGGKIDPLKIRLSDISQAYGDSLLKRVKKNLKKFGINSGIPVVYSVEQVKFLEINGKRIIGTCAHVPAIFGNIIGGYIFNSLANPDFRISSG